MFKKWVSITLLLVSTLLTSKAYSVEEEAPDVMVNKAKYPLELKLSPWSLETHLNAIASTNGPSLGASFFYNLDFKNSAGIRLQSSLYGKVYAQSYSVVYRNRIGEEKSSVFTELSFGFNHYIDNENNNLNNPFFGTNLGLISHWNDKVSWGVITGLEWSQSQLTPRTVVLDKSNLYLYGNLMFLASVDL